MARSLETLFRRYRDRGDVAALGRVFDRAAPELFRIGLHLARDPAAAEELVQETFLTAIEQSARWDASRRLVPWLTGILSNHARRAARAKTRTPDPHRLSVREAHSESSGEITAEVARALERLDAPAREVVVLHLRHGMAPAEIALVLDRAPGTVRSQLHRGLEQLRSKLPRGVSAAALPLGAGLDAVRDTVLGQAATTVSTVAATTSSTLAVGALVVTKSSFAFALGLVLLFLLFCAGTAGVVWLGSGPDDEVPVSQGVRPASGRVDATGAGPALATRANEDGAGVGREASADPVPDGGPGHAGWHLAGVVRGEGGAPLPGVDVAVAMVRGDRRTEMPTGRTDSMGAYRVRLEAFEALSPLVRRRTRLHVTAAAARHMTVTHLVRHLGLAPQDGDLRHDLQLAIGTMVVGRVVDARGEPVVGADVFAFPASSADGPVDRVAISSDVTDALGRYGLSGFGEDRGPLVLWARGDPGEARSEAVTVPESLRADVPDLVLRARLAIQGRLELYRGATVGGIRIEGRPVDVASDVRGPPARVGKRPTAAITDPRGGFTIPVTVAGTYELRVRGVKGWLLQQRAEAGDADVVLRADLRPIRVRVEDPEGQPLTGAHVTVRVVARGAESWVTARRRGDVSLAEPVYVGDRVMQVEVRGDEAAATMLAEPDRLLVVRAGATGVLDGVVHVPAAAPAGVQEVVVRTRPWPAPDGTAIVRLRLGEHEVPPEQLTVRLHTEDGVNLLWMIPDAEGRIVDVPIGTWRVVVVPGPHADKRFRLTVPVETSVTVVRGEPARIDVCSEAYGSIVLTLRDGDAPEGASAGRMLFLVRRADDDITPRVNLSGWRDPENRLVSEIPLGVALRAIRRFAPGRYELQVVRDAKLASTREFIVHAGQDARVEVDLTQR